MAWHSCVNAGSRGVTVSLRRWSQIRVELVVQVAWILALEFELELKQEAEPRLLVLEPASGTGGRIDE